LEEITTVETAYRFAFPPSYRGFIKRLPVPFCRLFARARFVVSVDEIRQLRPELGPSSLPFLADPQPNHHDYYCFDLSTTPPEYGITVFAIHATVRQWANLADWLKWIEQQAT
jgi:hypothetical protein